MKKKFEFVFLIILSFIGIVFLAIYLILRNKIILFILFISIAILIILICLFLYLYGMEDDFKKRAIKKAYSKITKKINKNIFEQFFMMTYNNKSNKFIKNRLEQNNIKCKIINNEIVDARKIRICLNYQDFIINIIASNNKVKYYIDSPIQYDGTKENNLFEETKINKLEHENLTDVNSYVLYIINIIKSLTRKIDEYIATTAINPLLNGIVLSKLSEYSKNLKKSAIVSLVVFTPLTFFLSFVFIMSLFGGSFRSIFPFIMTIIFIIVCLYFFMKSLISGITKFIKIFNIKKDITTKSYTNIFASSKKVKIITKFSILNNFTLYLDHATMYFDNVKLIMILPDLEVISTHNKDTCCKKCEELICDIKYLTRSKIIIAGDENYLKIFDRYLV